jgi:hypothetical protein
MLGLMMKNNDQKKIVISIIFFTLLMLGMCFAAMMSTYNDSVDPEDYDTDPPAVREEDFGNQLEKKVFVDPNKEISFTYPYNWQELIEEFNGIDKYSRSIEIINPEETVMFRIDDVYQGGNICEFTDSSKEQIIGPGTVLAGDSISLSSLFEGRFKRNTKPLLEYSDAYFYSHINPVEGYNFTFLVCKDMGVVETDPEGKHFYANSISTGDRIYVIKYYFVDNPTDKELEILDHIFSTLEVI